MKRIKKLLDKLAMWWLKPSIITDGDIIFNGQSTSINHVDIIARKVHVKKAPKGTADGGKK